MGPSALLGVRPLSWQPWGLESEAHRAGCGPGSCLCDRSICGRRAEHTPESKSHTGHTGNSASVSFAVKRPPNYLLGEWGVIPMEPVFIPGRRSINIHSPPSLPAQEPRAGVGVPPAPRTSAPGPLSLCVFLFPLPAVRSKFRGQERRLWGQKGSCKDGQLCTHGVLCAARGAQPSPYPCCSVFFTPSSPVLGEGALTSTISAGPAPSPVEVSRDEGLSV